jgi:leader peptidase (prepilin peptidase)/N-methyltransferase
VYTLDPTYSTQMAWLWPLLAAPFAGSFLGVLIRRLPARRPVVLGRSECDRCGARLAALDLVPLLSFAVLRGRCRRCGEPISPFHFHVELAALALAAAAAMVEVRPPVLWLDCVFGWALLALAWIDFEAMTLPDAITLPLLVTGLCATAWLEPWMVIDHVVAAALGYAVLRGAGMIYRFVRGRDGIREGDAKLLAAIGAWVGTGGLPIVIPGAALVGLIAAGLIWLRGAELKTRTAVPFGPCLALAGWTVRLVS